jgi:hypothetical protein
MQMKAVVYRVMKSRKVLLNKLEVRPLASSDIKTTFPKMRYAAKIHRRRDENMLHLRRRGWTGDATITNCVMNTKI